MTGPRESADPDLPELVAQIVELIEAGDDIRCYPSGAVGFDQWYEARDKAQLLIGRWVDEDGTWRTLAAPPAVEPDLPSVEELAAAMCRNSRPPLPKGSVLHVCDEHRTIAGLVLAELRATRLSGVQKP